jgi:iron complex transport system ATP-binding protein
VTALRLEAVAVALGGRPVLCGATLELRAGEVVVLAGPNGAGKTTLLRVATGVLRPDSGRVLLGGRPAAELPRREIARSLALVPQETFVPFAFRVGEVVLMGRAPHLGLLGFEGHADRRIALAALERVGIAELADRSVLELSGGERQLTVLARALAQDAPLLLLDEPTAHLDVARRLAVLGLARELAGEGRGVLLVSHDLALAARFADRVVLLAAGRVVADGPPGQVLDPDHVGSVFGVEAEVLRASDGSPVVVPLRAL